MNRDKIRRELLDLPVKHTRMIGWEAVTRWTDDTWEVGTWGKAINTGGIDDTLDRIARHFRA